MIRREDISLVFDAAIVVVALLWILRAAWRALRRNPTMPVNPQIQVLIDAEKAESARLAGLLADRDQRIADLTAKLAADDVASNAAAAKIAELTAATDPTDTIAALSGMVDTLRGIGVAPPVVDPAPAPQDPPAAPTA